jgi:hypothetical protein
MVRAGATKKLHGLFGLRPWGNKTKPKQRPKKKRFTAWTLEDLREKVHGLFFKKKEKEKQSLKLGMEA